jgi:hypothetical protein
MFEVIKTINFCDAGFDITAEYLEPHDHSEIYGEPAFMINVAFRNCFPISETGYRSVLGIPTNKLPEPEEIEKVILEVYHAQDRAEIKPPSLFDETPEKTSWEYDIETGEEQQTIFKEVKPETNKGEFVGDLFSYDEE